ncbi:MAG TPA: hypothetical protein V6C85_29985 [Allocoleopsis sp.]
MPLELPNLDDRTYNDLLKEALSMIPTYAPDWTNHNPSDPGITLIELFAYLTEMLLYRLNRVTDDNILTFLTLLNGPGWQPTQDLQEEVRLTVLQLRSRYRAVTQEDYQLLSTEDFNAGLMTQQTVGLIQRAHCVVERHLEMNQEADRRKPSPGHVSVVILPANGAIAPNELGPQPTETQRLTLWDYLDERRTLTTRLHVIGPTYAPVSAEILVARYPDVLDDDLRRQIIKAIDRFLSPLPVKNTPNHQGWIFGRDVYVSEFYELLEKLDGVDYLPDILLTSQCQDKDNHCVVADSLWNDDGDQIGLRLYDHHLPATRLKQFSFGAAFQSELNTTPIVSESLRQEFTKNGISLAQTTRISVVERDFWWLITETNGDNQRLYLVGREQDRLDVYDQKEVDKIVIVSNQNFQVVPLAIALTPAPNTDIADLKQRLKAAIRTFLQPLRRQPNPSNANPTRISRDAQGKILQIRLTQLQVISQNPIQYRDLDSQTLDLQTVIGVQQVNSINLPANGIIIEPTEVIDLRLQVQIEGG